MWRQTARTLLRPHLEKVHGRSAGNELWWRARAPLVINIVSMHRSIITIRSNTRRPRQTPLWGIIPDYYPERVATTPEQHLRVHYHLRPSPRTTDLEHAIVRDALHPDPSRLFATSVTERRLFFFLPRLHTCRIRGL